MGDTPQPDATTPLQGNQPEEPAYRAWNMTPAGKVGAYYLESTATANVEDPYVLPGADERPKGTTDEIENAAEEIAGRLVDLNKKAELVFLIHGFNNARSGTAAMIDEAHAAITNDSRLNTHDEVVFVGYRWPTEQIGGGLKRLDELPGVVLTGIRAASSALRVIVGVAFLLAFALAWSIVKPHLALAAGGSFVLATIEVVLPTVAAVIALWVCRRYGFLAVAVAVAGIGVGMAWFWPIGFAVSSPILWLTLLLLAFTASIGVVILRLAVYFRDTYRAINYAVPDLLDLIRDLDRAIIGRKIEVAGTPPDVLPTDQRVRLSFVGHSLGALVVTHLVRVLSDVFALPDKVPQTAGSTARTADPLSRARVTANSRATGEEITSVSSHIGDALHLGRLVLLSADIPAEALLMRRSNFLKASLRRFEEAYLFTSGADAVLRTISTLANYFSFPNRTREHGYRLGNAEVRDDLEAGGGRAMGRRYGIMELKMARGNDDVFLRRLRVGSRLLSELLDSANKEANPTKKAKQATGTAEPSFPLLFSYFDCSDYIDIDVSPDPAGKKTGSASNAAAKGEITANTSSLYPNGDALAPPPDLNTLSKKQREEFEEQTKLIKPLLRRGNGPIKPGAEPKMPALGFFEHFWLLLQYLLAPRREDWKGRVDIHGGYLHGPRCQALMYRLACLGFDGLLESLLPGQGGLTPGNRKQARDELSRACAAARIRVLLSPERDKPTAAARSQSPQSGVLAARNSRTS